MILLEEDDLTEITAENISLEELKKLGWLNVMMMLSLFQQLIKLILTN